MKELKEDILNYCSFKTSRSSGSGGQHINKVETKVELIFDLNGCNLFTENQHNRLQRFLAPYSDQEGTIHIYCQEYRSQWRNKRRAEEKLMELIQQGLKPVKARKPTAPTKASKEKRIQQKKQRSEVKSNRRKLDY